MTFLSFIYFHYFKKSNQKNYFFIISMPNIIELKNYGPRDRPQKAQIIDHK